MNKQAISSLLDWFNFIQLMILLIGIMNDNAISTKKI
jgi:hypothetical protein